MKTNMPLKKAFSIAEVCVACGILIAGLLPVLTMLSQGSSGTISNRTEIKAGQHVSNLVARCQLLPFEHEYLKGCAPIAANNDLDLKIGETVFDVSVKEPVFSQTLEIKDFKGGDNWPYDYKLVIAEASYVSAGGNATRSVRLSGLMSKWKN